MLGIRTKAGAADRQCGLVDKFSTWWIRGYGRFFYAATVAAEAIFIVRCSLARGFPKQAPRQKDLPTFRGLLNSSREGEIVGLVMACLVAITLVVSTDARALGVTRSWPLRSGALWVAGFRSGGL